MPRYLSKFAIDPNVIATLAEEGNPSYTGVNLRTSTQAIPIPVFWGTRRLTPNYIWQSTLLSLFREHDFNSPALGGNGFTRLPYGSDPGGPFDNGYWQGRVLVETPLGQVHYGDADSNSSGSSWWVPAIMALCEGPLNAIATGPPSSPIQRMWNGNGAAPIPWNSKDSANPTYNPTSLFYEIHLGTLGQAAWGFWAVGVNNTNYPNQNLGYTQTAYIASPMMDYSHGFQPPQQSFEVLRTPDLGSAFADSYNIGVDYCVSTVVEDIILSLQYGVGLLLTDLDFTSLANLKAYTLAQGILFSPLLTAQTACASVIDRWAQLSNSWIFWDGTIMRFVPLGDEALTGNGQTYTPDATPAYNLGPGDFEAGGGCVTIERADPTDCYNRVRLEFSDRNNNYSKTPIEWKDTTLINQFGIRDASSVPADDICDIVVAAKVVELIGKRLAYIRNRFTFRLSYRFIRILPGTIVTLTDANLGLLLYPVRITAVDEDEGGVLTVKAEEYPGTLGLSRPQLAYQAWGSTTGTAGGTNGGNPIGATGATVATTGGAITMTGAEGGVLYVAGDVITLPAFMAPNQWYMFKHDQHRSPQPTPALLEKPGGAVTFQRPGGATYTIEDPGDWTLAYASSVQLHVSGTSAALVNMGDGTVRWVQA